YFTEFAIKNAKRAHSGRYTIRATNVNGMDEETVNVNVVGAPSKPKGPLIVENVHETGCKLEWGKPDDDGGLRTFNIRSSFILLIILYFIKSNDNNKFDNNSFFTL